MTTPVRQYQNVSFKELVSYSENNPNRNRILDSIDIVSNKLFQETSLDKIGLNGYTTYNLTPSGIISLFACIQDPSTYSLSNKGARSQIIIDITTTLQEKIDKLKNTSLSRKRKRINELIGASYNGTHFEDKDYIELFSGLSLIQDTHFILMKSVVQDNIEEGDKDCNKQYDKQYDSSLKGEIIFSSDPSTWKQENPIWIVDYRAHWIAIPSEQHAQDLHKFIGNWLTTIEQSGWIIQWPIIDATKTEIVEQLSTLPTWQITDKKLTKDILASRLGRANCIKVFTKWLTCSNVNAI